MWVLNLNGWMGKSKMWHLRTASMQIFLAAAWALVSVPLSRRQMANIYRYILYRNCVHLEIHYCLFVLYSYIQKKKFIGMDFVRQPLTARGTQLILGTRVFYIILTFNNNKIVSVRASGIAYMSVVKWASFQKHPMEDVGINLNIIWL